MEKFKKYYLVIIGVFLLSTLVNPFLELTVDAANDGFTDALNTAPQGIDLSNGRFKMPETSEDGTPYVNPVSSKVVAATDGSSNSNRIVQVVNGEGQVGGIWGDPSRNNYISTDKKQTISMWINMSKVAKYTDLGDGFAFVLQNDDRKTNAMATTKDKSRIDNGETLGVWGYDNYPDEDPVTGAKDVASDAIQNSWALEIDSHLNNDVRETMDDDGKDSITSSNVLGPTQLSSATIERNTAVGIVYNSMMGGDSPSTAFDLDRIGGHIATGFPGESSTYVSQRTKWYKDTMTYKPLLGSSYIYGLNNPQYAYYYSMKHDMPDPKKGLDESELAPLFTPGGNTLLDGWHHLTITVDFPDKKIDYAFNDKNTDGTASTTSIVSGETELTDADVNGTGRFGKIKDNRIMYGFTGSTGTSAMNGLAIFEQIPGFAETAVTTDFKDISSNKTLASASDFAYSGEQLQLNYNLTYTDGNEPWTNVKSHIILPKNVDFNPDSDDSVGTVSVGAKSVKIPSSAITTDSSGNKILEFNLPSSMNTGDTSTATYSINGTAGNVTADTKVAKTHSRFIGDNGISDVDSKEFTIKQPDIKLTSTTENPLTVNKGQGATINGNVAYASGSVVTNSTMTVHAIVNGNAIDTFTMSDSDPVGQLTAKIDKDLLTSDTNTVQIYVTSGTKTSNSIMFTIKTKDGGLSLNAYPKEATFRTVNTTRKGQVISRSGDWDLSILDSRGSNNTWKLMAKSDQLHNGSLAFNGSLIFKTGNNSYSLTNNDVQIATGETISEDPVITDVDSTWTNDSGVLLESNGQNPAGTYKGTIDWTLYDSI